MATEIEAEVDETEIETYAQKVNGKEKPPKAKKYIIRVDKTKFTVGPLCRASDGGIPDPTFVDEAGAVTVTFKAEVVAGAPSRDQAGTKLGLRRDQVQVLELAVESRTLPGADGAIWAHEQDQVSGASPRSPSRGRPRRDDPSPTSTPKPEAAVPHDRGGPAAAASGS